MDPVTLTWLPYLASVKGGCFSCEVEVGGGRSTHLEAKGKEYGMGDLERLGNGRTFEM